MDSHQNQYPTIAPVGIRSLVAAKLGVCACCIRTAARGTAVGWAAAAAAVVVGLGPVAIVASTIAVAFTVVLLGHCAAYTARFVSRELDRAGAREPVDPARRRFMAGSATLIVGAVALGLVGFGRTVLAADECTGVKPVDDDEVIEVVKSDKRASLNELVRVMRQRCLEADVCPERDCDGAGECQHDTRVPPTFKILSQRAHRFGYTFQAQLTGCPCKCVTVAPEPGVIESIIGFFKGFFGGIAIGPIVFLTYVAGCTAPVIPGSAGTSPSTIGRACKIKILADLRRTRVVYDGVKGRRSFFGINVLNHDLIASGLPATFDFTERVQYLEENGGDILEAFARIRGTVLANGKVEDDFDLFDAEIR